MPELVSRENWLEQRNQLLTDEKEFSRLRDELSARRRDLPWVQVSEDYQFTAEIGGKAAPIHLGDLFGSHSQLIIYHFMYGADWNEGCASCSFWADNFDGIDAHLGARDASFAVVSIAPLKKLMAYKKRMGWDFTWISSEGNTFNQDYFVSFTDQQREDGEAVYNYKKSSFPGNEAPGISVFTRHDDGRIYHTYSTYSRGLDMVNGAYHFMDLLPKGRDEAELPYSMAWIKRHDAY
jgi:predicted dithiol-disulfide oxidoreductase (DUF899 family)